MKDNSKFFLGLVLVIVGGLLLIDTTGILSNWNINVWSLIWNFWPLILIFFGIKSLFSNNITAASILLLLGAVFLATNFLNWNFFAVLWPLLIIMVGLSILFRKEGPSFNAGATASDSEVISDTVAFWGLEKRMTSQNFKGGEVNVAFGGAEIDLREAKISKEGAKLQINAAFGGVEVFVPSDCRVITNGSGIFGGWNPTVKSSDVTEPVLEITGVVVFAGVDIKK